MSGVSTVFLALTLVCLNGSTTLGRGDEEGKWWEPKARTPPGSVPDHDD